MFYDKSIDRFNDVLVIVRDAKIKSLQLWNEGLCLKCPRFQKSVTILVADNTSLAYYKTQNNLVFCGIHESINYENTVINIVYELKSSTKRYWGLYPTIRRQLLYRQRER